MNIKLIAGIAVAAGAAVVGLFAKKGVDTLESDKDNKETTDNANKDNEVSIELIDPIDPISEDADKEETTPDTNKED